MIYEVRGPDNGFYRRFEAPSKVEAAARVAVMSVRESGELLSVWEDDDRDAFLQVQDGVLWPYREPKCVHNWIDARNQAIRSGELCLICGAIRPTQEEGLLT